MSPTLVADHIQNGPLGDAEAPTYLALGNRSRSEQCAHLIRECDRELDMCATPNVLGVRNQLHVRWIYARAIAAEMISLQPIWDRADELQPCPAMGGTSLSVVSRSTVTRRVSPSLPTPATRRIAAIADLVEICRKWSLWIKPPMMVMNESNWFSLHPSARNDGLHGERRGLPASALAQAARVQAHIALLVRVVFGARGGILAPHHHIFAVSA